jgi:sulfur-oxidizing protein SoxX
MTRGCAGVSFALAAFVLLAPSRVVAQATAIADYRVVGDAIPAPLTATPGDAVRGRAIVTSRQVGLCLLCHGGPFPEERLQGTIGTNLAGAGTRWSEGQLRLRVVDSRRLNPESPMPSYHRVDGLNGVASAWRGRPVLDAQQVEDVVALLRTLR